MSNPTNGPLTGLTVIEMGSLIAGPFCAQLLGDFGAEVIKVEDPAVGDPMRQWGRERPHGLSLWWPVLGRNKKSVTCDLRTPEGQDLARALLRHADVLVENFRPGTLERWGLSCEELSQLNPNLIIARISGFGQHGPYKEHAGYGAICEAMGGLRYITGDPSAPPSRVGVSLGDSLAGLFGALGVLAALNARAKVGGQVIDTAIFEAVLGIMESVIPEYALAGVVRERSGPILPHIAPSNIYPTLDGSMILIAANQDTVFRRLARAMDLPNLADDERFSTHVARGKHQSELDQVISDWTSQHTAASLIALLREAGVPVGKIYTAADMMADPHFAARESITTVAHPDFGDFPMQNVFPRLSKTPGKVRSLGPELGEHTAEVYTRIGISAERQAALRDKGII